MRLFSSSLPQLVILLGICFLFVTSTTAVPGDVDSDVTFRPRLRCKCQPHQPCWPSSKTWSAFNETIGGRLIATIPVARECFQPHYHKPSCDEIKRNYYYDAWRQSQPGGMQISTWETFHGNGCLLNQTSSCVQGAVPLYTVNVSSVADVQAAVRFASKYNIRLAVKNTGHDYLGRSTAASSLSVWTHFQKKIAIVESFVPEGAPDGTQGTDAVIFEAGVQWIDAYEEVAKHGRIVVGGMAPTVGTSGGYCLSGGHSVFSPRHGLCVDNVLQYKVVTADGEVRITNTYQHQDLFWALRGGGPGFGIVVEAVYRTHEAPKHLNSAVVVMVSDDTDKMHKVISDYYSRTIKWMNEDGWSGYVIIGSKHLGAALFLPDGSIESAHANLKPFIDNALSIGVEVVNNTITQFPSLYAFLKQDIPDVISRDAGFNAIIASRLIPRSLLESDEGVERLTSTMRSVREELMDKPDNYMVLMVAGGQVAKGNSQETSVVPAWRQAQLFINHGISWSDDTPYTEQIELQRKLTKANDALRRITPGSGTYQNEADPNEPNFQQSFFGANYPRLYKIKHRYDPQGLFVCRRCVGSDDWNSDGTCPRRR